MMSSYPEDGFSIVRLVFYTALALFGCSSVAGNSTTFVSPPVEETVREVAATGMLISGQIIQAFDASKRQPEIIRADKIFVGEDAPRDFVIYHANLDYEPQRRRDPRTVDVGPHVSSFKLGQRFERLVLMPAKASNDPAANGRWTIHFWGGNVAWGQGFKLLAAEATRLGRFRSFPPRSAQTGGE